MSGLLGFLLRNGSGLIKDGAEMLIGQALVRTVTERLKGILLFYSVIFVLALASLIFFYVLIYRLLAARLDDAQLASLDRGHPTPRHRPDSFSSPGKRQDLYLAVVGEALAGRIQEDGAELRLRGLQIGATIADLEALEALGQRAGDILIIEISGLQDDTAERIVQAIRAAAYRAVAVVYPFGANSAADNLQLAGVRLYHRPANRSEMRQMLRDLARDAIDDLPLPPGGGRRHKRFDERELQAMMGLARAVTCECPRHIIELILQLDAFETYSDNCSIATPADQMLHRLLGDISNQARHAFEMALERVATGHLDSMPS